MSADPIANQPLGKIAVGRLLKRLAQVVSAVLALAVLLFLSAGRLDWGMAWALIPGRLAALLFVVKTAAEDRMLLAGLEGYREYTERVRYRLLPGIW